MAGQTLSAGWTSIGEALVLACGFTSEPRDQCGSGSRDARLLRGFGRHCVACRFAAHVALMARRANR